jgi:hypothetical protein
MTDGNTDQNNDRDEGLSGEGCSKGDPSDEGSSAEDLGGEVSCGRDSATGAAAKPAGIPSSFGVKSSRIE